MATSEYLRNRGQNRAKAPVLQIPAAPRRTIIGPETSASALMIAGDVLSILLACGLAVAVRNYAVPKLASLHMAPGAQITPVYVISAVWFVLAYVMVARRFGLYSSIPRGPILHQLRLVVQGCLAAGLLLCGILYLFHAELISRLLVMMLVAASAAMLCGRRTWWRYARVRKFEQGVELRNVVVLGTNQLSYALSQQLRGLRRLGYAFVGFVAAPGAGVSGEIEPEDILGGVDKLRQLARQHFVDELVIAEFYPTDAAIRLVQDARELNIDVRAIAGYYGELTTNARVEYLGIFPVAALHRREPRAIPLFCKRVADIGLSLVALALTLPLMLVIAAAVKLESEGPVFYISNRIGKRGRVFPCFKFRTMVKNAEIMKKDLTALNERDGILFKVSNDPRITGLGRLLRKYSLDELPQFLNVLRGEMSLVGPRPPLVSEVEKYELEHFRRLEVMPGLTGLWQVQARHDPSFARYIALDTAYVENWTFWLDLRIMLQTANVVIRGTGT
ncbi:MAG TPA: sugar transferase [Acidobacteriaceae bacterium]|jgi:exopolysaccharide biosynthesis polyprenyl glycosylphosphotransferase|nr:sugar transferase [Acidobacteriaceae bacterium]